MSMKRAIPIGLLAVVVVAAALSLTKLGLFHRPSTPHQAASSVARRMSQSDIEALLRHWSYPGAKQISLKLLPPRTQNIADAANLRPYVRSFLVNGPPAKVRFFYASKIIPHASPNTGAASSGSFGTQYGAVSYANQLTHSAGIIHPGAASDGSFTKGTNDYAITARVVSWNGPKQSEVIVVLVPYEPVMPTDTFVMRPQNSGGLLMRPPFAASPLLPSKYALISKGSHPVAAS